MAKESMQETPRGLRLHIGIFGRRNAGKSSLVNAVAGQEVSIVSSSPGTTTDVVEKTMELGDLGPVVLLDSAGLDDAGSLGQQRCEASRRAMRRVDLALLITAGESFDAPEREIAAELASLGVPFAILRNKADLAGPGGLAPPVGLPRGVPVLDISAARGQGLEKVPGLLRSLLPGPKQAPEALVRDLLPAGALALLVAPIDAGAPQGRLILPQVQAIRDCLDGHALCLICRETEYAAALAALRQPPALVICDSQAVALVAGLTPPGTGLTTFSILMARFKGELPRLAAGAAELERLRPGDMVLIQEACSHHSQEDDIATVKLPRLLRSLAGGELDIRHAAGKDFSRPPAGCRLVVHCGACVITRKQMLARQQASAGLGVPMTNYGLAFSAAAGILERTLAPFPEALAAWRAGQAHSRE